MVQVIAIGMIPLKPPKGLKYGWQKIRLRVLSSLNVGKLGVEFLGVY